MTLPTEKTGVAVNIEYIKRDIAEIKTSVKELANVYVTKQEFEDRQLTISQEINALQRSSNIWKVASPSIASVLTAVIVLLLISFLQSAR